MIKKDLKIFIKNYGLTSDSQLAYLANKMNFNLNFIGLTNDLNKLKSIPNGSYIVNIGDDDGTHWTCFYIENDTCFYFDSFSVAPEDDLINILSKKSKITKLIYNSDFQFQDITEDLCGIWCLVFLHYMNNSKKKNLIDRFYEFSKNYKDLD